MAQAASLALTQACPPFEALQQDAAGPGKSLRQLPPLGRPLAADELALLPPAQRPVATALAQSSAGNAAALLRVKTPRARWPLAPCSVQGRPGAKWSHWQWTLQPRAGDAPDGMADRAG